MHRTALLRRSLIPAVVLVALLSACTEAPGDPEDANGSESAATATPGASDTASDDGSDDSTTTDSGNSGNASSGNGNSGNGNSGNANSGSDSQQGQASTPPVAPSTPPSAEPTVAPAAVTIALVSGQCQSGAFRVTVTANYDGSHRKGITGVEIERQNEYNAWISSDATWLGPETGQGNQWTGSAPGSKSQRFKETVRITATASGGATATTTTTVSGNC